MITKKKTYLWGLWPKTTVFQCSQHLCKFRFVLKLRLQWSLGNCFLLGRCCLPRKNFTKLVILRGLRPKDFFHPMTMLICILTLETHHEHSLSSGTRAVCAPSACACQRRCGSWCWPPRPHAPSPSRTASGSVHYPPACLSPPDPPRCLHKTNTLYTRTQQTVNSVTLGLIQFYLGKLAFKHLVGGLTKMLELKYTLFRFTLHKTSKTLGLKEVLKCHPNPFWVYTFFSNKFSRKILGKIFIFQAMNTTQIHNKCHNFP